MRKIKPIEQQRFYTIVMTMNKTGLSIIESICKVMDMFDISYGEVEKLVDPNLREEMKKEAIEKHLIKCQRAQNLENIFFGGNKNDNA